MSNEIRKPARKLTAAMVEKVKAENDARTVYPDTETKGLELRVAPDGSRSFALLYRVKGDPTKRRIAIGDSFTVPLDDSRKDVLRRAREVAAKYRNDAGAGIDPREGRKQQIAENAERRQNTLGAVAEDFLKLHVAKLRSAKIAEGVIRRELMGQVQAGDAWTDDRRNPRWRDRPITSITRRDVVEILEKIVESERPYLARLVLAYARKLFNWAIGRDMYGLQSSPCAGVSAKEHGAPTTPRQVILADDHLRLVWRAAEALGKPTGSFVQMLFLSGQRRNEIAFLQWSEINKADNSILIPAERMKAKRAHEVPLSPAMVTLLDGMTRGKKGDYVFSTTNGARPISGFAKLKQRLDKKVAELQAAELEARKRAGGPKERRADLAPWRLHDARRTMRTAMSALPIPYEIRELVIAHVPPTLTRTYDLHSFREEKRHALQLWSERLKAIADPPAENSNVVTIGDKRSSAARAARAPATA